MDYTEVSFNIEPIYPGSEILIAGLAEIGYESFEETDFGVKAYIHSKSYKQEEIDNLSILKGDEFAISYSVSHIKNQNWNEVWESSYEPVMIKNQIYIRASFHAENKSVKYQLLIEPKMSFGTAHHETTSLMMELLLDLKMEGKNVLDMGCGTGILAILSEMMGSSKILAIDNDLNAFENTLENITKNKCRHINVEMGGVEKITGNFDFILANINKNILLSDMKDYVTHLNNQGRILFSGFYEEDMADIKKQANTHNLTFEKHLKKNRWVAAIYKKIK